MSGAPGTLFVIAAPSGTGKSTVTRRVLERVPALEFSVSYTTRAPRPGEADGVHYHFVSDDRFDEMADAGAFLEWARVFDRRYGTGLAATRDALAAGRDVWLDIDVQGAAQVRRGPVPSVSIMLLPPGHDALEARLRARGSEDGAARARRLREAGREAAEYRHFDYLVVNDDLDRAVEDVVSIVRAERRRVVRARDEAEAILRTFPAGEDASS